MSLPDSPTIPNRLVYIRRVAEMRIAPSSNGSVNHDSIVYLVNFALGNVDNLFYVSGAIRCSGATQAQIKEIIDLISRVSPESADINIFLHRISNELGIAIAPHRPFPSSAPDQTLAASVEVEAALPAHSLASNAPRVIDQVTNEARKVDNNRPYITSKVPVEKKNGPASIALMVIIGLFGLAVFLGFFFLWARDGWSAASEKSPVGAALLFITIGFIYMILIPLLRDKGYRVLSTAMLWLAFAAGGVFTSTFFPSCNSETREFPLDRPYRK